nr:MAG TPA: tail protein [Caudoviricetes sp.]
MIPVLYKANETKFDSQGVGCLTDCITCYVHEKLNGVYELKFTYPITGVHFSDIKVGAIVDAIPSDGKAVQHFRIETITKPIGGKVTVEATHISYQLSYVPVKPFDAVGVLGALNGLKENSLASNPFSVWTNISNTATKYSQKEPASFRQRLGGVAGSILDCFGGEYEFDNYTVKLYAHRGIDRGVVIEYGKNLTDLEQEESIDKVITGIVPFWKDSNGDKVVSIETPIESEYASKYPFKRTVVKDFSTNFEKEPTVEQLRAYTESYIKNNCVGVPQVSLDVSFVALEDTEEYKSLSRERINLGDTVTVRFAELGVDAKAKVIEYKYDVLAERYDSLKIGSVRSSLASTISEITKVADSAVTKSILDAVIKYQTELIKGGLGGYVVTNYANGYPSEIIVGDSPNIEQMVNCIRLNKNGLGISKSGYNGPYSTAITGEGINADLITTGQLNGNLIKANSVVIGALDEEVTNKIDSAQSSADKANTNASNAQNTANNAQDAANKADAKADQAKSDAAAASLAAQKAKDQADKAQKDSDAAKALATNAWNDINDLEQVVIVDSSGVRVLESKNSKNYSHIKSDGMHVFNNGNDVAQFGQQSKMNNLAVKDYMMFGTHRAELSTINEEQGTAFYWIGDIQ